MEIPSRYTLVRVPRIAGVQGTTDGGLELVKALTEAPV